MRAISPFLCSRVDIKIFKQVFLPLLPKLFEASTLFRFVASIYVVCLVRVLFFF